MSELSSTDIETLLADVVRIDGPKVIFPHGAKVVEVDGEKVLRPLTPDEYRDLVLKDTGVALTDEQILEPGCAYAQGGCISQGCTQAHGRCSRPIGGLGGFYCLCNY